MKTVFLIIIIFPFCAVLRAQEHTPDPLLRQMADSVNYLLRNSKDGFVQPFFSVNTKGDMTLLDAQKTGFRFNLFSLAAYDSTTHEDKGIVFVPEDNRSITTNKFILFKDTKKNTVGLFKFTRTDDSYVRSIHAILLRIRSYIVKQYTPD